MSDISNLANTPIEFPIGAVKYKVSRLTLIELFTEFEALAKQEYFNDILALSNAIKDKAEKTDLIVRLMRDMPSGKRLEEIVKSKMDSMDGGLRILFTALKKHNKISYDEVVNLSSNPDCSSAVSAIIEYCLGNDVKKEESSSEKKV